MNKLSIDKICIAGILLGLGYALPFLTGQIPEIGNMLCPMHIPVLIAGFILGPYYGLILGFILPISRSAFFGMPYFYPTSIAMAFELATYGFLSGFIFKILQNKLKTDIIVNTLLALIIALFGGRIVWGIASFICNLTIQNSFTFKIFLAGAFINAWPGIILQIIIIPLLIKILSLNNKSKKYLIKFKGEE